MYIVRDFDLDIICHKMKLLQSQVLDNMKLLQSLALAEGVLRIKRHWTVYEITKYACSFSEHFFQRFF